ncbi:MAG TPA: hypothetical protein VF680_16815 [Allosphingosinicella sp.]|jgi:hypothetical protein
MILKNKNIYRLFNDENGDAIEPTCTKYIVEVLVPTNLVFHYTDCEDIAQDITLGEGTHIICAHEGPTTSAASSKYTIALDGEC